MRSDSASVGQAAVAASARCASRERPDLRGKRQLFVEWEDQIQPEIELIDASMQSPNYAVAARVPESLNEEHWLHYFRMLFKTLASRTPALESCSRTTGSARLSYAA